LGGIAWSRASSARPCVIRGAAWQLGRAGSGVLAGCGFRWSVSMWWLGWSVWPLTCSRRSGSGGT